MHAVQQAPPRDDPLGRGHKTAVAAVVKFDFARHFVLTAGHASHPILFGGLMFGVLLAVVVRMQEEGGAK